MKKIEIIIDNQGQTTIEASGYQGGSCLKATEPLRKALIGAEDSLVKKPEFYQPELRVEVNQAE